GQCGIELTTCTLCFLTKSGRSWYFLLAKIMVRLERTIKSSIPTLEASSTNHLKLGFISGAPPVKSKVWASVFFITPKHCNMVSLVMISLRSGPASTWQCEQVWLHI